MFDRMCACYNNGSLPVPVPRRFGTGKFVFVQILAQNTATSQPVPVGLHKLDLGYASPQTARGYR